jgi:hypothetical protein
MKRRSWAIASVGESDSEASRPVGGEVGSYGEVVHNRATRPRPCQRSIVCWTTSRSGPGVANQYLVALRDDSASLVQALLSSASLQMLDRLLQQLGDDKALLEGGHELGIETAAEQSPEVLSHRDHLEFAAGSGQQVDERGP